MTIKELSWFIDDTIARELQAVKGVGEVRRVGGVDREIRVALDPDRLLALGITAGDVSRQLRATNVDVAGGKSRDRRQPSRPSAPSPAPSPSTGSPRRRSRCRAAARSGSTSWARSRTHSRSRSSSPG